MKAAVRAIIIHDNKLLVMERKKFGKHYITLVGGHVEFGESKEKALLREIDEETQITIANPRLVFLEHVPAPYGDQYIYIADFVSGEPQLRSDSDEIKISQGGENIYHPMWIPLKDIDSIPFRSEEVKQRILTGLKSGFPTQVEEFTTNIVD